VAKGILNYTTTIGPMKSATECIGMLAEHGATDIGLTSDRGTPTGIMFRIGTAWGPQQFTMPVNVKGVETALDKAYRRGAIQKRFTGAEHASRVAWRVVKDWLEVQLALVEAGVADLTEVMIGYMNTEPGKTLYQSVAEQQLAIEAGR